MWVIAHQSTHIPIGVLIFIQEKEVGEIHFGLAPDAQKQGFMQEAISTALCFLKKSKQLQRIETFCAADNLGSKHVLEKTGFQAIQYLPKYALFPNWSDQMQDCVRYQLLFS